MAQKLSGLWIADGKKTSHRDGALPLRQIRLEGVGGKDSMLTTVQSEDHRSHIKDFKVLFWNLVLMIVVRGVLLLTYLKRSLFAS